MPIPSRVSVVALRTADVARSTAFYVALGWELSAASTAAMSLFKTAGSLSIHVATDAEVDARACH
jgi:catechol 2,3-dioxygenase-like lactoylglutathione lyase family enzyme